MSISKQKRGTLYAQPHGKGVKTVLENGKYTESIHDMTAPEIWAAWKNQQLNINQVVIWQQKHKLFFNHKGEIVNE